MGENGIYGKGRKGPLWSAIKWVELAFSNFHRSLKTMQPLPIFICKYTSKIEIQSRGLYNFCETLLFFEDPDANKRGIEILTNDCFLVLNHREGLMSA